MAGRAFLLGGERLDGFWGVVVGSQRLQCMNDCVLRCSTFLLAEWRRAERVYVRVGWMMVVVVGSGIEGEGKKGWAIVRCRSAFGMPLL